MPTETELASIRDLTQWVVPSHGLKIESIDTHCGGEPMQVILSGIPIPVGRTILERKKFAEKNLDHIRQGLVKEPRGHSRQYGAIITPPERLGSHYGVIFYNDEGFRDLSGHGVLAVATVLVETGLIPMVGPETRVKIDTAAGAIRAYVQVKDDRVKEVFYESLPSFVIALDQRIEVPQIGEVRYDLAYGGVVYAYVNTEDFKVTGDLENAKALRKTGQLINEALKQQPTFQHPDIGRELSYGGVVFCDRPPRRKGAEKTADTRQVCVFSEGEINRCPGGAAISARLALEMTRGKLDYGQMYRVESIIGSTFQAQAVADQAMSDRTAILCEIQGSSVITGFNSILLSQEDPYYKGFSV
jgi:proline racemase